MKILPKLKKRRKHAHEIQVFSPESLFPLSFSKSSHLNSIKKPEVKNCYQSGDKDVATSYAINLKSSILNHSHPSVSPDLAKIESSGIDSNYISLNLLESELLGFGKKSGMKIFNLLPCLLIKNVPIPLNSEIANIHTKKYETHRIVLGIDFGTSSSKIVVRDDTVNDEPVVIYPEHQSDRFPAFAFPESGLNFSSLKICLICLNPSECGNCPFSEQVLQEGKIFKIPGMDISGIEIKEITTIFLAFLISYAKLYIKEPLIKKNIYPKFFYHMGAPIDAIDSEEKNSFEECLFLAEAMVLERYITDGMALNQLHRLYQNVKSKHLKLPPQEQRDFFVLPETYAGLISYLNAPKPLEGLYAIVDIGAFTTDISCFWYHSKEKASYFYCTNTYTAGCNDIDLLTLRNLQETDSDLFYLKDILSEIRQFREKVNSNSENIRVRMPNGSFLERDIINNNSKKVGEKIRTNFLSVLGKARQKDQLESTWKELKVFVVGGGARIREITNILKMPLDRSTKGEYIQHVLQDTEINLLKHTPLNKKTKDDDLLWVAAGLSIHKSHWQEFILPSKVEPIKTAPKEKFDWRERLSQYDG